MTGGGASLRTDIPAISVVVPVHNGAEHTARFLESLSGVTYPNFDLYIIDDGSTDNTAGLLRGEYPFRLTVIKGDGSLWWTASMNLGVRAALKSGADYILTTNNDTTMEPGFMDALIAASIKEHGAIVGPMICYSDDHALVWSADGIIRWYSGKLFYTTDGRAGRAEEQQKGRRKVGFVHAMGALIPAEVYKNVGFYDEDCYPQYHADAEFSMRAGRAGYELFVEPAAVIYNDAAHSRAAEIRKSLNIVAPLFDRYSPYNLRLNWKLYRDYAPGPAPRLIGYCMKYARYFLGTFKYIFSPSKT